MGKPEGSRPLGRTKSRLVDNDKLEFRKTEWCGMVWIDLAQGRNQWRAFVNTIMKF